MSAGDERSVEDVQEVRDRSLADAYEPHDVLQRFVVNKLTAHGYRTEQFGIDDRHSDDLKFSAKPDLAVTDDGDCVGYVEIKSKELTSADWFGRLNKRHWENYLYGGEGFAGAHNVDVPVILAFGVVDTDTNLVCRHGFIEVSGSEQVDGGFVAHGNVVVKLDENRVRNVHWLNERLQGDR